MEKRKETILLDIDEVLCFSGYLELVNEFLNTNYTIDDFSDYYIDEAAIPKEKMGEFCEFMKNRDQYENPMFLPHAIEAIKNLSNYYDIYPLSDCRNNFDLKNSGRIFKGKFELLYRTFSKEEIPSKNYIFTGSKGLFQGDIQIDDLLSNLQATSSPTKILFPSYHNKEISEETLIENGVIMPTRDWRRGWEEIEKILLKRLEMRKNHE